MTVNAHLGKPPRTPLQSLGARWPLAVLLAVLGLLVGLGLAASAPTTYTAESRVAVNAGGLSTGALAGLPLAASQLASNYARYLNDQTLSGNQTGSVAASPIPDSNVIRVEGFGTSEREAVRSSARAARALVSSVKQASGGSDQDVLAEYSKAARSSAEAQQGAQTAQGRVSSLKAGKASAAAIRNAQARLVTAAQRASLTSLQEDALATRYRNVVSSLDAAQLKLISDAHLSASDRVGRLGRYGILGLVLGAVLALLLATLLERRSLRRR